MTPDPISNAASCMPVQKPCTTRTGSAIERLEGWTLDPVTLRLESKPEPTWEPVVRKRP